MSIPANARQTRASAFDLNNEDAYRQWREGKLATLPPSLDALIVEVQDISNLKASEKSALKACVEDCNMAIYACRQICSYDKSAIRNLGREFGLERLDHNMGADDEGITELEVKQDPDHKRYIPYTTHAIHWHTDGYYNTPDKTINGMLLHCVEPAIRGGANELMDHELAYIHLRDLNPEYIKALMQVDTLTIPANIVDGKILRPDRSGPVFSLDEEGYLQMRFTERARNINWKDDPLVSAALEALSDLLHSDTPFLYRGTLQSGQGLICNNVLHNRSRFEDDELHTRLLYRLRYYDRVAA